MGLFAKYTNNQADENVHKAFNLVIYGDFHSFTGFFLLSEKLGSGRASGTLAHLDSLFRNNNRQLGGLVNCQIFASVMDINGRTRTRLVTDYLNNKYELGLVAKNGPLWIQWKVTLTVLANSKKRAIEK